jgi:two-component system, NtrC family, response regulator AtoC
MTDGDKTSSYAYGSGASRQAVVFWEGGGGSTTPLAVGACVTIGRGADSGIRVDHGSVSRTQARLWVTQEGVEIEDAGSSNGTRVNAQRLPANARRPLLPGEIVEMGAAMLVVQAFTAVNAERVRKPTGSERSDAMSTLDRFVTLIAKGKLSIILVGETGVGKEVWARRIHERSDRKALPFVGINCAAIAEQLLESELFGHEKGAFTGADRARTGLLESAAAGTVYLDEITELPQRLQAKLLRVLENHEVFPVGSSRSRPIGARFLSSTNRDIEALVAANDFRADLYFRLNGITLRIPPLRERLGEIDGLATEFATAAATSLGKHAPKFTAGALRWLRTQPWLGNIRELKNRVECACLLCGDGAIDRQHLVADIQTASTAQQGKEAHESQPLWREFEALERQRILEALAASGGNQSKAAAQLGISRRMLINRLDRFGVQRPRRK